MFFNPAKKSMKERLNHIFFHRHLVWEFLRRDLQARYVGSAMGFFWSVINPLILLGIYTFVFGIIFRAEYRVAGVKPGGIGAALYIFSGLLPWYAFQESLIRSTTSIVDNAHLIKQVRFPAKVLPLYLTFSSIVNQIIGTLIFLPFLLLITHRLPATIVLFPVIIGLQIVLFFGLGLFFSTLNTYLRDVGPLVTVASMILMWCAPVFYQMTEDFPALVHWVINSNPLTYLITFHHQIMLEGTWPSLTHWMLIILISFIPLFLGYWLFTRCHREFADLI